MNNNCYKFHKITYNDGLLSKSVDATYIIHLEGNGRYKSITNQIKKYHITNIIYILFNKGYKKCKKDDKVKCPPTDLLNANIKIFEHAKMNNYNNILVLEDDFILNDKIKDSFHINNINKFLLDHKNKKIIYALGTVPVIQSPYDFYTVRIHFYTCAHALIFSSKLYNELIIDYNNNNINMIHDSYLSLKYIFNSYMYYLPLCYQLWPETDNSKYWVENSFSDSQKMAPLNKYFANLSTNNLKKIKNLIGLDKQPEPGFTIIYTISKIISLLIFILLIYLIYRIVK